MDKKMKKDFFKDYCTDEDLEKEGVWMDVPGFGGAKVKVARYGNKDFLARLRTLLKPYQNTIRKVETGKLDYMPDHVAEKLTDATHRAYAEFIVLDWEGIHENDQPMPFKVDNVMRVFKKSPKFFAAIHELSEDESYFRKEVQEEMGKNSQMLSSGN